MKKNLLVVFILFFYISTSLAQNDLNAYKYIIVPKNYEFLQKADQYELNSLTKFLFEKKGFETLFETDRHPVDLFENPCLGLVADIMENSSMLTSKLTLYLTDCNNKVIFTAKEGRSKEKDYKKTYHQALRRSFTSIEELDYKYNPDLVVDSDKKQDPVNTQQSQTKKIEPKPADIKTATAVAAPIVVDEVKKDTKTNTKNEYEEVKTDTVVDVPFAVIDDIEVKEEPTVKSVARSYKNENISFFLIDQNNELVAYVIESNTDSYKKGEIIGTFVKTSLPNVFKVSWKNKQKGIDETIAYFDDAGNLKVEINRNGKIEVIVFKAEK
jgi:hypothetical protein